MLPHTLFLLRQLTKREILARYRGTALGILWYWANPLLLLAAFVLVFHGIFDIRWPGTRDSSTLLDFAINVFIGLTIFNFFAEALSRSPSSITNQPNLVTKIVFPLELIACSLAGAALFNTLAALAILLLFSALSYGINANLLLLPPVILVAALYVLSSALILSALGVYLRDLTHLVASLVTLLLFLNPVFYPVEQMPQAWQELILYSPIAWAIEAMRDMLVRQQTPPLSWLALHAALAGGLGLFAWRLFNRLKRGFADVL